MTDDPLVRAFEAAALDEFPHAAHVRVAWWYVTHEPLLAAIARFRTALRRFAATKGKPDRYHETITIALLLLIAERRRDGELWEAFAMRCPDLLLWPCPTLLRFYSPEVLDSSQARQMFVAPDLELRALS
jgi:hypothetical protein